MSVFNEGGLQELGLICVCFGLGMSLAQFANIIIDADIIIDYLAFAVFIIGTFLLLFAAVLCAKNNPQSIPESSQAVEK
jgi:hypothetical protein